MKIKLGVWMFGLLTISACTEQVSTPAPARAEAISALPDRQTVLAIPVEVELDALRAKLEEAVPRRLAAIDENRDACVPAKMAKVCVLPKVFKSGCAQWVKTKVTPEIDCHLSGHADRGDIVLTASGNALDFAMPISAAMTVRGRGDIGKHIRETARMSVIAKARVAFDIDESWRAQVNVEPDFSWRERAYVRLLGIKVTIGSHVEPEIRKALDRFKREIETKAGALEIKTLANEAWKKSFQPIAIGEDPAVWLQFAPQAIGLSKLIVNQQVLRFNLYAKGGSQVHVRNQPPVQQPSELPPLMKESQKPQLNIYMPVFVDYAAAAAELAKALQVNIEQTVDVPGIGPVVVTITQVEVYPTAQDQIAVGLSMVADPPGQFFNTQGTIWATTRVEIDNEKRQLRPLLLNYGGETDNAAVNLLIGVAQAESIKQRIMRVLVYDFSEVHAAALQDINAAINRDLGEGLSLQGEITSAGVDEIRASAQGVYMGLEVEGELAVRVRKRDDA